METEPDEFVELFGMTAGFLSRLYIRGKNFFYIKENIYHVCI